MIFNASYDPRDGSLTWASVYACEAGGKVSFQLLSREMVPPKEEVTARVDAAAAIGLDVAGLHEVDFQQCPGWR